MPLFPNIGRAHKLIQPVFFLVVMLTSMTVTASSYLQELDAEAASTNDGSSQKNGADKKPGWSSQQSTENRETLEKGLTKEQFQEALKAHFYGSYLFYSNLSDSKQEVVYEEYLKNNDIEHLREVIKAQMSN